MASTSAVCKVALVLLLVAALTASAPSYPDYDNVRDLYELLLQREAEGARLAAAADDHQLVRKSNRSPSLRLRFGRRSDPLFGAPSAAAGSGQDSLAVAARSPSLRLRFGRRSDPLLSNQLGAPESPVEN
ncbi:short neuropeptide F [Schistocerca nitens]|uniref:short neuropeptide F n=1 Tax=Schistocerca nitens TaxID=7011 RepID=UPI0021180386|nr:short neuropeptide F [Schistocerca nitens]